MVYQLRKLTFLEKAESMNIYANIRARNKNNSKRPLIIFSAHYDSFSALITFRIKKIVTYFFRILIIFYLILLIFIVYFPISSLFNFTMIIISLITLLVLIPLLYLILEFSYKTTGSIDNASGTAILIELAKILKESPLKHTDVLFVWCGAEEWGLKGSKKFCRKHYKRLNQEYDLNKSININIDMVGSYIGLLDKKGLIIKKKMNRNLNNIIASTAKELNIPLKIFSKAIEPRSDHVAFRTFAKKPNRNFQVGFFHSDKDTKYIHSLRDTPDKCSKENLNGCLNICLNTVRAIDSRVENP
jgi:hypothetical protein